MSDNDAQEMALRQNEKKLRSVSATIRKNIELRKEAGSLGTYGEYWKSVAATCDEVAEYLKELADKERGHE